MKPITRTWYSSKTRFHPNQVLIQRDTEDNSTAALREKPATMPRPIVELAYKEYVEQGHGNQSLDKLLSRGGFGKTELIMLLADRCERLNKLLEK